MAQRSQQCSPGYSYDWGRCSKCSAGMTSDGVGGDCYCDAGTFKQFGCTPCLRHQYSTKNSTSCTDCGSNEISMPLQRGCMQSSDCNVDSGFVIEHQSCICPANRYLALNGSACIQKCGDNESWNSIIDTYHRQSYCMCENGYVMAPSKQHCIPESDCNDQNNMKLANYVCTCKDASMTVKFDPAAKVTTCEGAISCSTSQFYDKKSNSCQKCRENAISTGGQAETCTCVEGFEDVAGSCVAKALNCQIDHYLQGNACVKCPDNSTSKGGASTSCDCTEAGAVWEDGSCTLKAPDCAKDQFLENNSCRNCPPNSTSNGGSNTFCTCTEPGAKWENGKCVAQALKCQENHYISNNQCTKCPENSTSPGGDVQLCSCTEAKSVWVDDRCEVKQGAAEENTVQTQGKGVSTVVIVVPIVVIILIALLLVAVLVPLLRRRKQNRLTKRSREDIV